MAKKCLEFYTEIGCIDVLLEHGMTGRRDHSADLPTWIGYDDETGKCPHHGYLREIIVYFPFEGRFIQAKLNGGDLKRLIKQLQQEIDAIEAQEEIRDPYADE